MIEKIKEELFPDCICRLMEFLKTLNDGQGKRGEYIEKDANNFVDALIARRRCFAVGKD